ncbi:Hypothetical predicted protein [Octopus vulgaris]|uniref:SPIN-DOC-like zinc-finger domain-containing protein n=1 Tax=Octopus vulgaris TaxID=6645 RepID=A0AA36F254_OCTVU|nr:Hypothetical predicted protein [Octopus vulgaris]
MAKRKVDAENRAFKIRWETEYMFTDIEGKPVCLNCGANVAVLKEYNLKRHYETNHHDRYKYLPAEQKQRKGRDRMICDMYDAVKIFQVKLRLWETQMHQLNLSHFPCCQVMLSQVNATVFPKQHFADKLSAHRTEFARRFSDFKAQKNNFDLLRNLFAVNGETAPVQIQMELIELQCNGTLKVKYDSVGPAQFTRFMTEAIPQVRLHAAPTLFLFGITYLCEQLFSVMKMNKTSHRWTPAIHSESLDNTEPYPKHQ